MYAVQPALFGGYFCSWALTFVLIQAMASVEAHRLSPIIFFDINKCTHNVWSPLWNNGS